MGTRILMLVFCLVLPGAGARHSVAQDQPTDAVAAREILRLRGLSEFGHIWITRREVNYKRSADALENLERRHQRAAGKATEALAQNEQIRAGLAAEEAARRQKPPTQPGTAGSSADRPPTGEPVKATADKLKSSLPDVTGLGEQTPLQMAMIELASARVAAQLAALEVIQNGRSIEADYLPLRADARVTLSLQKIGKAKLGPARNYQRDLARAQALAPAIFSKEIPCFFESGQFRTMVILNEAQPATVSIEPGEQAVRITHSVAQRLGILPAADARELRIGQRSVSVRPVKLNSLRMGPVLLRNVSALVLPPEAEDLGSWISTGSLAGWKATRNERGMMLVLAAKTP